MRKLTPKNKFLSNLYALPLTGLASAFSRQGHGKKTSVAPEREKRIFGIASGKGGVGKTWVSVSLAHALAQQNLKVLLFDGDLGLANVDIQLGLTPSQDLGAVLSGQCPLSSAIVSYVSGSRSFDVIAGRSGCGSLSTVSQQRLFFLQEQLKSLAEQYDVVLIDLGAGVCPTVRALASVATDCIVVTTEEPTALTDAYAFMKAITRHCGSVPFYVVVNQGASLSSSQKTYHILKEVCGKFLSIIPLFLGMVRRDERVRLAIQAQALIFSRHPQSGAAHDIYEIAQEIVRSGTEKRKKCLIL